MNSHDFIADMDESLPMHGCPRCGDKLSELNCLSNGRPVSCHACAPGVAKTAPASDWRKDLENWAKNYAKKQESKK